MQSEPVIFIVDDDPAARNSLAALVKSRGLPVETFSSAEEFLEGYDSAKRGCLIADVRMTGMSGLELQEQMAARSLNLPVIVITGFADVPMAVRAMRAGAVTFLEKPCGEQEIWDAIQTALEAESKSNELQLKRTEIEERYATLKPTELEVLKKLMAGQTSKTIAYELQLGLRTVELRRANIMDKMGAHSLPELVRLVLSIRPDEDIPLSSPPPWHLRGTKRDRSQIEGALGNQIAENEDH
jgi:two-component system, LuxR family, response regulator FixJ